MRQTILLALLVAKSAHAQWQPCSGHGDCGGGAFCGIECWTGNCQQCNQYELCDVCQPCDECHGGGDSVDLSCAVCNNSPPPGGDSSSDNPDAQWQPCSGHGDCGSGAFCGIECWTGNCQQCGQYELCDVCQPCNECHHSGDSVDYSCAVCIDSDVHEGSAMINGVECAGQDIVIVAESCVQGHPHYDFEGMVCAYDYTDEESYCSYDVGPMACARCEPSSDDETVIINGESCPAANVVVVADWCVQGHPHYDFEGMVCAHDNTEHEAYCAYDISDTACARCDDSGDSDGDWHEDHDDVVTINGESCPVANVVVVADWCVQGSPHWDYEGMVCAHDNTEHEAYCAYDISDTACARCDDSGDSDGDWHEDHDDAGFVVTSGHQYCEVDANGCVHDGGDSYANHEDCKFEYRGNALLVALDFEIEEHWSCMWDWLKVDGHGVFCGNEFPSMLVSGVTTFTFHTDYSVTRRGFHICAQGWD